MWASPHRARQACRWSMDEGRESCTGVKPKMDGELPEGRRGLHLCFSWGFIKVCDISARSDRFSFIRKSPEGLQTCANCTCQEIDGFSQQPLPGAICHLSLSSKKDLEAVPTIGLALALHRHPRPCFLLPWSCRRTGGKAEGREWACQPQVPARELGGGMESRAVPEGVLWREAGRGGLSLMLLNLCIPVRSSLAFKPSTVTTIRMTRKLAPGSLNQSTGFPSRPILGLSPMCVGLTSTDASSKFPALSPAGVTSGRRKLKGRSERLG